jgi:hypothetical protein
MSHFWVLTFLSIVSLATLANPPVTPPTYGELVEKSDLVCVLEVSRVAESPRPHPKNPYPETVKSYVATCKVMCVFQGEAPKEEIRIPFFGHVFELPFHFAAPLVETTQEQHACIQYLAFLKRAKDGVFEPAAGDLNAGLSFRLLLTSVDFDGLKILRQRQAKRDKGDAGNLSHSLHNPDPGKASIPRDNNRLVPIETNFVRSLELSPQDLETVVKLANLCRIERVTKVSTEHHVGEDSILVRGDEEVEGRKIKFKKLRLFRDGWLGGQRKGAAVKSVGEFWIGSPARPEWDERTLVRVGERTFQVGLLDRIQPVWADKVIEAFVTGRVHYTSDFLERQGSQIDFAQPLFLGFSAGKNWIRFSSPRGIEVIFTVSTNEVTIRDIIHKYE